VLVSIHQPHYLPWLRYLENIARSELFIVLDDADFNRNGWQNRNKIKTSQGSHILTAPVHQKLKTPIRKIELSPQAWARKHWMTLTQSYAGAPCFAGYKESLATFYGRDYGRLVELNAAMLAWHMEALGLKTPCVSSSTLPTTSSSTARLVELVLAVGGTGYLTGQHALEHYLDPALFRQAGLELWIFSWTSPTYRQLHPSQGFIPDLATLDLLLCEGGERAAKILSSGSQVSRYDG
jgi:hypothetical protein